METQRWKQRVGHKERRGEKGRERCQRMRKIRRDREREDVESETEREERREETRRERWQRMRKIKRDREREDGKMK